MPSKKPTVFDKKIWGLATRPVAVPPAAAPAPPPGPRRPFESGAYQDQPWGPFPTSPSDLAKSSPVLRITDPAVELKFGGVWRTICRHDLPEDLSWGRLVVGVSSVSGDQATRIDLLPLVEVRIIQMTSGIAEIIVEGAAAQRQEVAPWSSPGPLAHEWEVGEIPDGYEVQARARRGGEDDTPQEFPDAETLLITVTGRFHR